MERVHDLPTDTTHHIEHEGLWVDQLKYLYRSRAIWWKYFKVTGSGIYDLNDDPEWKPIIEESQAPLIGNTNIKDRLRLVTLPEVKESIIFEAYTCKDRNSHLYETLVSA